jgi:hypothetical protein
MLVLFGLTIVFFPLERPYWWVSILTFFLIIIITLTKIMLEMTRRFSSFNDRTSESDRVEISYTFNDEELR